jgi:hypothetical protein
VNAIFRPSGDQNGCETNVPAGRTIFVSLPSSNSFSTSLSKRGALCGPFVASSMRSPASRANGCATSAIGGYGSGEYSSTTSRARPTLTRGVTAAFNTSSTAFGGF